MKSALVDAAGRGRRHEIFDDSKAWVINIACQKPTAFGLSAELWNPTSLTRYINSAAVEQGYPRMATASEKGRLIPFSADEEAVHTLSYDEKPGIQAISTTAEDRPPVPNTEEVSTIMRDYEYKRLGTVSLLAAIDLLTGEVIPLISDTHKSSDFVNFLRIIDEKYPKGDKVRIILDNHSAHTSRETQEYLNTVPERFEFVFTPTHGSWLNMVEEMQVFH